MTPCSSVIILGFITLSYRGLKRSIGPSAALLLRSRVTAAEAQCFSPMRCTPSPIPGP